MRRNPLETTAPTLDLDDEADQRCAKFHVVSL